MIIIINSSNNNNTPGGAPWPNIKNTRIIYIYIYIYIFTYTHAYIHMLWDITPIVGFILCNDSPINIYHVTYLLVYIISYYLLVIDIS